MFDNYKNLNLEDLRKAYEDLKEAHLKLATGKIRESARDNKVRLADSHIVDYLAPEVDEILKSIGIKDAWVSDMSCLSDFDPASEEPLPHKLIWKEAIDRLRNKAYGTPC